MEAAAKEERRAYMRAYRMENRNQINQKRREWNARNPERVREHNRRYWEKRAEKRSVRASWEHYGITKERFAELKAFARSPGNSGAVLAACLAADGMSARHIFLSLTENLSFEDLEKLTAKGELGRLAVGRSNFYGLRRLAFHYLDVGLAKGAERGDG